jgi:hypothetical protein
MRCIPWAGREIGMGGNPINGLNHFGARARRVGRVTQVPAKPTVKGALGPPSLKKKTPVPVGAGTGVEAVVLGPVGQFSRAQQVAESAKRHARAAGMFWFCARSKMRVMRSSRASAAGYGQVFLKRTR